MRIGFDAKRLYNNFTGLGNYSRTLVGNLHHFFPENDYFLYTPKIKKDRLTSPFFNGQDYQTICPQTLLKSLWRSSGIKRNLKRDHIDIFHGLSHEIPIGIDRSKVRSVVTIHDIIFLTYPDMFTAVDRAIYNYKFRYACRHADKIIAISECTKQDIIRYFGTPAEKIEVIYQAIQPAFYSMRPDDEAVEVVRKYKLPEDYLLYVGAINSRKNLLTIVKALPLLPQDMRIPLVVVGNGGSYKEQVLQYAEKNGLSNRLIFINNLHAPEELQAFYQKAKIFIYPSFYEGFGLPVTEALLSKVPVITSGLSSLPEAGGPDSCYINPERPEEIAHAIENVLSDTVRRQVMIEKGFRFACQQFDVKYLTEQVNQLYQKIL